MPGLPEFPRAFRLPLRRHSAADLEEEFAFHLEMKAGELIARGWAPDAARAEARRLFGDLDDARTFCRRADERREKRTMRAELLTELRQDLGYALRMLRRAPAFTIVAALTLALGIGANTAIFSVVRGILLRPLPFHDPGSLVTVAASYNGGPPVAYASPANLYDWRDQNHSFTSLSVIGGHQAVLTGLGDAERLGGADVSADFFGILGVAPLRGRITFTPEEAAWKGPKTVLLSESVWRTRFGADTAVVGSMLTLDNERYRVAGIVPAASAWPADAVLWFPFSFDPEQLAGSRGAVYLGAVARLKPGATLESATTDMSAIAKRLEQLYPINKAVGTAVVPLQEWVTGSLRRPLLILLGGVAFVLLIACANVANLLLVRGVAREGELAVRTALGAGRGRLVRQLVTESLVLALTGGAAGFALAIAGTKLLVRAAPPGLPRLDAIHVDGMVLAFTIGVAVITGVVFGLLPARQVVRADLAGVLREGGRGGTGHAGRERTRRALIVAEVALSVMLLAASGLLIRSFERLTSVAPGFRTDHTISFGLSLPDAKYGSDEQKAVFVSSLMERMRALPGVQSAGAALGLPLTRFRFGFSFAIAGMAPADPQDQPSAEVRVVTPGYFTALAIPVVKGRAFTDADRAGGARVLLVTEAAAKQFFGGQGPIGRHVTFGWGRGADQLQGDVVGVVGDVKQTSLATATLPQFYAPFDQKPVSSFSVVLHTSRDPQAVAADARSAIREIDRDLAVTQVRTLDEVLAASVAQPRFYMVLLSVFAFVALALSAIGIYGVIAYLVGQRSREIGIRIALGASAGRVVGMILREGAAMAGLGLGVGLVGALALTRLMGTLLFGVTATDPLTYVSVAAILAAVAVVASCVPAVRAARVDPALTMRTE
ncbi:MAG: ADOP family duplicated permease [Gemmatimonadales bacterium]